MNGFDAFNLSDIFEYLDASAARELYAALVEVANPGLGWRIGTRWCRGAGPRNWQRECNP